jgi:hypothetical protein
MKTIIDWQLLALKLRQVEPLENISRRIGRHSAWLAHIARGEVAEPKYSDGVALLNIAASKLPESEIKKCRR